MVGTGAEGVCSPWISHRVIQHHGNFPSLNDSFWNRNVKLPSVCSCARPKLLPFYKHSKNIDCLPHNQVGVCFNPWHSKLKEDRSQSQKIWLWQTLAVWTWATHFNLLGPGSCTQKWGPRCAKRKAAWCGGKEHRLNSQPQVWLTLLLLTGRWHFTVL